MKKIDLSGRRFGRLIVISFFGTNTNRKRLWKCKCDCGTVGVVVGNSLASGNTTSCGCYQDEIRHGPHPALQTHGLTGTGIYSSWNAMMKRCYNSKTSNFRYYGARGIKVCEFIRCSPLNLLALLGNRPEALTLDRKDNMGHYSCGQCAECLKNQWVMNVRWASWVVQANNKRNSSSPNPIRSNA